MFNYQTDIERLDKILGDVMTGREIPYETIVWLVKISRDLSQAFMTATMSHQDCPECRGNAEEYKMEERA